MTKLIIIISLISLCCFGQLNEQFAKLQILNGADYLKAKNTLLKQDAVSDYLESRIKDNSDDFLAIALYEAHKNSELYKRHQSILEIYKPFEINVSFEERLAYMSILDNNKRFNETVKAKQFDQYGNNVPHELILRDYGIRHSNDPLSDARKILALITERLIFNYTKINDYDHLRTSANLINGLMKGNGQFIIPKNSNSKKPSEFKKNYIRSYFEKIIEEKQYNPRLRLFLSILLNKTAPDIEQSIEKLRGHNQVFFALYYASNYRGMDLSRLSWFEKYVQGLKEQDLSIITGYYSYDKDIKGLSTRAVANVFGFKTILIPFIQKYHKNQARLTNSSYIYSIKVDYEFRKLAYERLDKDSLKDLANGLEYVLFYNDKQLDIFKQPTKYPKVNQLNLALQDIIKEYRRDGISQKVLGKIIQLKALAQGE